MADWEEEAISSNGETDGVLSSYSAIGPRLHARDLTKLG